MFKRFGKKSNTQVTQFLALITSIKPRYRQLIIGLLFGATAVILQLWVPVLAKDILNQIPHDLDSGLIVAVGLLFIFSIVLGALSGSFLGVFGEDVVYRLRAKLWHKILSLPISYLDHHQSGQIASRMTNDAMQVKDLLANSLPRMATSLLQLIGALLLMLAMDWKMTAIMFISVPVISVILLPVFRLSSGIAHNRQNALAKLNAKVSEVVSKMKLVKSSNAFEVENQSGQKQMHTLYHLGVKEAIYDSIVGPTTGVVILGLIIAILSYGVLRISHGTMTNGTLMAFLMYMIQLIVPFTTLGQFMTDLAKTGGATGKIRELLDVMEEPTTNGVVLDATAKTLTMRHVSFAYTPNQPILHDVSFTARPNSVVAFVGPSGSGKTTIFNLLERFYQPDEGEIDLGGISLNQVNLLNRRHQLGLVGQNADTMSGTIRYNLTYGDDGAVSDDQLWQALSFASAKDFVMALPQKLDTPVGENGANLSGGQRQRLAIARAFLRDPKILMLDEATASLDSESERAVQTALQRLMKHRTTLIIAHRINTIINADDIYFIENGRVSGHGTHAELLKSHPLYRQYFNHQLVTHSEHTENTVSV